MEGVVERMSEEKRRGMSVGADSRSIRSKEPGDLSLREAHQSQRQSEYRPSTRMVG